MCFIFNYLLLSLPVRGCNAYCPGKPFPGGNIIQEIHGNFNILRRASSISLFRTNLSRLLLLFLYCYGISIFSPNAGNGKIASFHLSERDGHRLKAAPKCVAWFARERLWRHRRHARRYRGKSACFSHECGWYRGRFAFRPKIGMEGIFVCLPPTVNYF